MGKNDYRESRVVDYKNKGDSLRQKPRRLFPGLSLPWVTEVHGNRTHLGQPSLPHTGFEEWKSAFWGISGCFGVFDGLVEITGEGGRVISPFSFLLWGVSATYGSSW